MPPLSNARHERFAQELASGKTAVEAHGCAGFKPDDGNACRLANRADIQARVQELTGKVAERVVEKTAVNKAWVIERLVENVDRAMQAEAVSGSEDVPAEYRYEGSVANRALELIGKELGMFVERKEVGKPGDFGSMTDEELFEAINKEVSQISLPDKKGRMKLSNGRGNGTAH